ncbi:DNA alkylation repair protein [Evansella tamaricis]|uniref:DNA alkylation repair protein n=1 Tax=Evansella tamaricis TaxID=2069301 RepID=A0ABS6JDF4_9BACI|nr:DNA alkylation repair protein [Evansella tamaricis]MBU9711703.1 DNA alkylation repair protein [Evansella tamaricis]
MAEALKNMYNRAFFEEFSATVKSAYHEFDKEKFLGQIFNKQWGEMELKQRMRHITTVLGDHLPPYEGAIEILVEIAPNCSGFPYLFFPDYVEVFGLEHWDTSVMALEEFTKYSSAEFAVRPFIIKDQEKMMGQMKQWSEHENHHVRRLASEGCRPRLPWGMVLRPLKQDPTSIFPILEQLKQDPSEYVRKSVSNNLNDISKDHPEKVKQITRDWMGVHPHTDWIVKHACRTLLKAGDVETLELFGYTAPTNVSVNDLTLSTDQITLGERLLFSFVLKNESQESKKLRVEYAVDYRKANGKLSRKIFQLSSKSYPAGAYTINRHQDFKNLTTRKHYDGIHGLSILVNGEELARTEFYLKIS